MCGTSLLQLYGRDRGAEGTFTVCHTVAYNDAKCPYVYLYLHSMISTVYIYTVFGKYTEQEEDKVVS